METEDIKNLVEVKLQIFDEILNIFEKEYKERSEEQELDCPNSITGTIQNLWKLLGGEVEKVDLRFALNEEGKFLLRRPGN